MKGIICYSNASSAFCITYAFSLLKHKKYWTLIQHTLSYMAVNAGSSPHRWKENWGERNEVLQNDDENIID